MIIIKGEKYIVTAGKRMLKCHRCDNVLSGKEGYLKLHRGWVNHRWDCDIRLCDKCCGELFKIFQKGYKNRHKEYERLLKKLTLKRLKSK